MHFKPAHNKDYILWTLWKYRVSKCKTYVLPCTIFSIQHTVAPTWWLLPSPQTAVHSFEFLHLKFRDCLILYMTKYTQTSSGSEIKQFIRKISNQMCQKVIENYAVRLNACTHLHTLRWTLRHPNISSTVEIDAGGKKWKIMKPESVKTE